MNSSNFILFDRNSRNKTHRQRHAEPTKLPFIWSILSQSSIDIGIVRHNKVNKWNKQRRRMQRNRHEIYSRAFDFRSFTDSAAIGPLILHYTHNTHVSSAYVVAVNIAK